MGTTQSQIESPHFFKIANPKDAITYLQLAEDQDGYIEAVQQSRANAVARQEMTYATNKLSPRDAEALQERINSFLPSLPPKFQEDHIRPLIISLMPTADGGMPHTRSPNLVCLPFTSVPLSLETFVHELWHIHQRQHWSKWNQFYQEKWLFKPFDQRDLPEQIQEVLRLNPDTCFPHRGNKSGSLGGYLQASDTLKQPLWIWNGEWVPMCVFLNPMSPSFKDTATWFYNVKSRIHYKNTPRAFATFFSESLPSYAYEHPNEISAYMLGNKSPPSCQAYNVLIHHLGERAKIVV